MNFQLLANPKETFSWEQTETKITLKGRNKNNKKP